MATTPVKCSMQSEFESHCYKTRFLSSVIGDNCTMSWSCWGNTAEWEELTCTVPRKSVPSHFSLNWTVSVHSSQLGPFVIHSLQEPTGELKYDQFTGSWMDEILRADWKCVFESKKTVNFFCLQLCDIMKSEAPGDKGRAAEGNRQRFGRLYVSRALNHIRIIVIGSLLNHLRRYIFIV